MALPAPAAISPWFTRQPPATRVAGRPPAKPAILCHCDLIPDNVRPGPDGLVVIDWEHAGALPPGWEFSYVVAAWCAGQRDATGACALPDAYRECGGPDLGIFAAAAAALLNFTAGLAARALAGGDTDQQAFVFRNLIDLLTGPLDRAWLELLLGSI